MTYTRIPFCLPVLLPLLLVGCGTMGGKPATQAPAAAKQEPRPEVATPATKRGGYYLDDGPGDNPPANLDSIPDAVPRPEPLLERSNRPYVALGETYTPMTEYRPYQARGVASWYGRRYHGNKTSSGEVYDMYAMTAAHTTLPIPSYARVTNPDNGKSVVVRINDRGPFRKERLIDLSYAAAHRLGLVANGSGTVEVEAIDTRPPTPTQAAARAELPVAAAPASGAFVQVGAFRSRENADQLSARLQQQRLTQNAAVENWYNDGVYRVRVGPFASRDEAERAAGRIRQTLGISTLVTTQ